MFIFDAMLNISKLHPLRDQYNSALLLISYIRSNIITKIYKDLNIDKKITWK